MKKLFFPVLALTLVTSAVSAQGIRFGIKAGANMNKVTGQSFNDSYDLGYHLGAFSEINFSPKFGIQPEVVFNQVNTKRASGFNELYNQNNMNPGDIQLSYLSIPILLKYDLLPFLSLHLGPQFGVLINHDENLFDNGAQAFKDGDFSAVAGAQLNLSSFRIYGRYNIGLQNINEIGDQDKWRSEQVQIGLGITF